MRWPEAAARSEPALELLLQDPGCWENSLKAKVGAGLPLGTSAPTQSVSLPPARSGLGCGCPWLEGRGRESRGGERRGVVGWSDAGAG